MGKWRGPLIQIDDGYVLEPGGLVTFTLRMTNTSQADVITITVLSDTIFNDVTTSNHDGITFTNCLLPHVLTLLARSYECYFVAQVAGNALFQHQNNVVARGIDDDNQAVSAGANAQVNITDLASNMIVTKTATPSSVPETGGLVTYAVVVQNLSAVDSISVTTVTDNHFGDIGSSCTPVVTTTMPVLLTPGASINCSFTRLLPPGNFGTNHTNEVTAFAIDDDNQSLTKKDSEIVTYSDTLGRLEVIKTANPTSVPESGGVVTYSVVVRNISVADTITVTSVSDDKFGDIGNHCTPVVTGITPVVLAAGQSFNCTFLGTLLPGNVGSIHTNTVTARGIDDDGGDPVEARDSESVTYSDLPASLLVTKAANVASVSLAGAIVTFTLRVENSSAADGITINTLLDSVYGNVADAANPQLVNTTCVTGTTLALNGVYQCQFSAFVSGRVGDSHINTLTVRATDSDNQPISGQDSETITIDDVIIEASKSDALVQDGNQDGIANPGDVVGYTIVVRNSGNVAATGVVFNDQLEPNVALINNTVSASPIGVVELGNNAGDVNVRVNIGTLAAQAAVTIRFNVRIDNPLPFGVTHIANQGQVNGTNFPTTPSDDPQTPTPDDPTVTPIVAQPLIFSSKSDQLVVDADNDGFVSPGDTLEYRVFIVNNGNQAATGIVFNDTPDANTSLEIGSLQTSQGTIIKGDAVGDIAVQVEVGTLNGNGGNVAIIFRVRIVNPLPSGVTQVSNQGIVSGGNIINVRTDDPDTAPAGDPTDTPISTAPLLDASKRASLLVDADNNGVPSPGDTINYQVTIINRGNTTANDVIFDDQPDPNTSLVVGSVRTTQGSVTSGNIAGNSKVIVQIGALAGNGGEVVISFDVRIHNPLPTVISEIKNQGLVTSRELPPLPTDDPATPDLDDPTRTPVRFTPRLDVNKPLPQLLDADGNGSASPGDTLLYTLEIFNRGNGPATNVVIEDVIEANLKLVNGSVQTSLGNITSGNNPGDNQIRVTVVAIPGNNGVVVITFRARINNPLRATVGEVRNQALVQSNELPPTVSDDPAKSGTQDPTITPVTAQPRLEMTKQDTHINVDNDPNVTLTDVLLYRITIVNFGNTAANNVVFKDTPDLQTALINGSVQTTAGTIEDGNDPGDKSVTVHIGTIPAGGTITISFRVVIIGNRNNVVSNQALVEYANPLSPREQPTPVVSNDPDTAEAADPTKTIIMAPNALDETEEPQMRPASYLPLVAR